MPRTSTIRFLTPTTNQKGDLFTRLMTHVFQALGYEISGLDVQKPGREIDIEGKHLYQATFLRAECKAHEGKMGGRELNAFYGVVTREREKTKRRIDAYFISLGGFTEPGKNQEEESGDNATTLLDSPKIIAALEKHNILLDDAAAAAKAGQCAGRAAINVGTLESIELVAYEKGYAKVVYYAHQGQRTHFALIHADGTALAKVPAQEVIDADQAVGGALHRLIYLAPPLVVADLWAAQDAALAVYRQWLSTECGYVELDGLPANSEISSSKLKLERLFIPLKALAAEQEGEDGGASTRAYRFSEYHIFETEEENVGWVPKAAEQRYSKTPIPISELLAPQARLAFLSPPGGGKSTLLKRLASEYGLVSQSVKFADKMPKHNWFPLLMRCRDLLDQAREPFIALLEKLPKRLNMLPEPAAAFTAYIHEALQLGQVLLLIDGLDEITQEGSRKAFTKNLLSFLAMFPQVTVVLTSREAGFRLVADAVANTCQTYKLAPFDEEDVRRLSVQWHAEVINASVEIEQKALKLAKNIWDNKHIRGLAENPLLLTTLLVVNRRRGGELPKNRVTLYGKAVEVLIQTWNAEAFDPLDERETLMQLSYVACYMMEKGTQQIGERELIKALGQAREVVAELRFTQDSPAKFIKQVEYRSSLLMQVGTELLDGEEQAVFEFRHLTFQEYLAAKGYVEGYHPRNKSKISLADLLAPNFGQANWREVIPLAAVLARRDGEETVARLVDECTHLDLGEVKRGLKLMTPIDILRRCVLDEVTISSDDLLHNALRQLGRLVPGTLAANFTQEINDSKLKDLYQQVLEEAYLAKTPSWLDYMSSFSALSALHMRQACASDKKVFGEKLIGLLSQQEQLPRLRGMAALAEIGGYLGVSWSILNMVAWPPHEDDNNVLTLKTAEAAQVYELLDCQLKEKDEHTQFAAVWALAWVNGLVPVGVLPKASTIAALFVILNKREVRIEGSHFESDNDYMLRRWAFLALQNLPLLGRDALLSEDTGLSPEWSNNQSFTTYFLHQHGIELGIFAAWYRIISLPDEEIVQRIDNFYDISPSALLGDDHYIRQASHMLGDLGETGRQLLLEREKKGKAGVMRSRAFISHSSPKY